MDRVFAPKPPILFANRVIRMMVDHSAGEEYITMPEDYTVMRVTFRRLGGSWEAAAKGDVKHLKILRKIVEAWAAMPGRRKDDEFTEWV